MQRRTDLKAGDFVRCFRCRRLTAKKTSVEFDGVIYGAECVKRAFSNVNHTLSDLEPKE